MTTINAQTIINEATERMYQIDAVHVTTGKHTRMTRYAMPHKQCMTMVSKMTSHAHLRYEVIEEPAEDTCELVTCEAGESEASAPTAGRTSWAPVPQYVPPSLSQVKPGEPVPPAYRGGMDDIDPPSGGNAEATPHPMESTDECKDWQNIANDIPLSLAVSAFGGVSMSPDRRGMSAKNEYGQTMAADYETMHAQAVKGGTLELLPEVFARYRERQASSYKAYLSSSSRCVSSFIAGPANFPVARMQKRNDIAHKRLNEYLDGGTMAKRAAIRSLRPDLRAIMSGDADAIDRLSAKIASAERSQDAMKAANKAIRTHAKAGQAAQIEALMMLGFTENQAIECLKPDFCGRVGFPGYALTNNNANIRRMRERLEQISKAQAQEVQAVECANGVTLEDDAPANRVRLFFPGKPSEAIRDELKASGFRWAPSVGAWQAYRNHGTLATARRMAGEPLPAAPEVAEVEQVEATPTVAVSTEAPTPAPVEFLSETPAPAAKIIDSEGCHMAAGRADFAAGKPRILPSYFIGISKNAKDWYRGWDAANLETPTPPAVEIQPEAVEAAQDVKKDYIMNVARYCKDKVSVNTPSADGYKTRAARLAETFGRWSSRENGYIMSRGQASTFAKLYALGWDGSYFATGAKARRAPKVESATPQESPEWANKWDSDIADAKAQIQAMKDEREARQDVPAVDVNEWELAIGERYIGSVEYAVQEANKRGDGMEYRVGNDATIERRTLQASEVTHTSESGAWTGEHCKHLLKAQGRPEMKGKSGKWCAWLRIHARGVFSLWFATSNDLTFTHYATARERMAALQALARAADAPTDTPPGGGLPCPAEAPTTPVATSTPGTPSAVSSAPLHPRRFVPDNGLHYVEDAFEAWTFTSGARFGFVMYLGKSAKPWKYYGYPTEAKRDAGFERYATEARAIAASKVQRKADSKAQADKPHGLQVGDVVRSSWGYDQTNVNHYQVTAVIGKRTVEVRELNEHHESTGDMTGRASPIWGDFAGEPMRRQVDKYGQVNMLHATYGRASKIEPLAIVHGVRCYAATSYSSYA